MFSRDMKYVSGKRQFSQEMKEKIQNIDEQFELDL